jgi:hypothetical protein
MSVSEQVPIAKYEGDGYQSEFWVPFKFLDAEDLVITSSLLGEIAKGGYTVNGTVVTLKRTPPSGEVIAITRKTPAERIADYDETGKVSGSSLNDNFDRPIMILQEVREELDRCLKVSATQIEKPEADISEAEKLVLAHNENPDAHKNTFLSVNGGNITGKFVSTTQDNYAFNVNGHEAFFRVDEDNMYLFVTGADDIATAGKKFRPFGVDFETGRSFVNSSESDSKIPASSNDDTAANTKWVTENFIPRKGGKLLGTIYTESEFFNGADRVVFQNKDDTHPLWFRGGTSDKSSAFILSPADSKQRKASFTFRAGSYTSGVTGKYSDLIGTANGELYWNGIYIDIGYPGFGSHVTFSERNYECPYDAWVMLRVLPSTDYVILVNNNPIAYGGDTPSGSYGIVSSHFFPVKKGDFVRICQNYENGIVTGEFEGQYFGIAYPMRIYKGQTTEE